MMERRGKQPSVILWTLVFGAAFNLFGWLGNNILLDELWDAAGSEAKFGFTPPWPPIVREVVTVVSDFVYAFAIVWIFANARRQTLPFALQISFIVWLIGPALVYLVIVNGGFLPAEISLKTSLLALAIFAAAAPILPRVLTRSAGPADQ